MKFYTKIILLVSSLFVLLFTHIFWGSVALSWLEIKQALLLSPIQKSHATIIWEFRMPKIIAAMIAGASLAISGLLMQTFFRNPIAGPFVLGISSGASLGVAVLIMASSWLSQWGFLSGIWATAIMAMLGASAVLLLLLLVSYRIKNIHTLLILGLMFGSATGAIVTLLQYFSSQQALQQFAIWSMGSLTAVSWPELMVLVPICSLVILLSLGLSKSLDSLLLGERYALSMGVNVRRVQQLIILATAILAGSITAFCGPIAFVGIAVPHLARLLFRTHRHLLLLITTALLGMITLLFCQLIAQLPGSNQMLPINVVTAFMGAPMVIWLVIGQSAKH